MDDQHKDEDGGDPRAQTRLSSGPQRIAEVLLDMFELITILAVTMPEQSDAIDSEVQSALEDCRDRVKPTLDYAQRTGKWR